MYNAKVLADSVANGTRLTTLEVTFPRIVLAEFNTHRVFSRNSASSRAIPVEKRIKAVMENPFVPEAFGQNIKGMQAGALLDPAMNARCRDEWIAARDAAVDCASKLAKLGVHKQWANRLIEPFSWHTVIVTATEWDNFFALRCHPDAQPEIRTIAEMMQEKLNQYTPLTKQAGDWHLPLVFEDDLVECENRFGEQAMVYVVKLSVARCARVSYLTHEGKRDLDADFELYNRLISSGHRSPAEHAARVGYDGELMESFPPSNFREPWIQHRKDILNEAVFTGGK